MSRYQSLWRVCALAGLALLVSGCAPGAATSTQSSATPARTTVSAVSTVVIVDDPIGPPAIVLKDTSPGQLALALSLTMGGYDASTRDMIGLGISFTHQKRLVQFVAGEHITCNCLAVPGFGTNFELQVSSATFSGKLITCTYSSGKTSATFTFTCPQAPAILSPQEGAQVKRGKQTPVQYRIAPDGPYYLIALDPPQKAWTPTAASQPNPVTLNTSAFPAGPGSIAISQYFTLPDLRGPAFQSVEEIAGSAEYEIAVNWV